MESKFSFGRLYAGVALVAAVVLFFVAFSAAPTAFAGGGSCFEQMEPGAVPQSIEFLSSTYTVTVSTDVCVESGIDLLIGFVDDTPFAVNGNGASASGSVFLYPVGPVLGTLGYEVTAASPLELVLTDVNATGGSIMVWLGTLKSAPAASATPTPVASATSLQVMKAGDKVTTSWTNGNRPVWGPFTPVVGDLSLEVAASVAFTMTSTVGYADIPAQVCGTNCWKAVVAADGSWEAPELKGLYWTDVLVGSAGARVLVPAPAQPASPAGSAKPPGGGGATGAAPNVWGARTIIGPSLPRVWGWALN